MDKTLLSILSGLGGMIGWGTSDFFANTASERVGHNKTLFWSQIAGLLLMGFFLIFVSGTFTLSLPLLILTVFCGIMYAIGYLFFYKGFEIGNVSVISATINIQVLFVIAISFFIRGQELSRLQVPAIALLLFGILLVSVNFKDLKKGTLALLTGVKETLIAAVIFGIFYWPVNEFIVEQADWILVSFLIKLVAIFVVFLIAKLRKQSLNISKPNKKLIALITAVGTFEAVGVLSASFGQAYGDGIIVTPIASALTIATVGLAMVFSSEKINKIQGLGIVLTVCGIIMTAL